MRQNQSAQHLAGGPKQDTPPLQPLEPLRGPRTASPAPPGKRDAEGGGVLWPPSAVGGGPQPLPPAPPPHTHPDPERTDQQCQRAQGWCGAFAPGKGMAFLGLPLRHAEPGAWIWVGNPVAAALEAGPTVGNGEQPVRRVPKP